MQYRTGRTIRIIPTTNTGTITVTYNTSSGNKTLAVRNADGAAKTFICDPYGYWWSC